MDYPHVPSSSKLKRHLQDIQQDAYSFFLNSHTQYGDALKLSAYNVMPVYSFSHPDAMQHILVKERNKYSHGKKWEDIIRLVGGNGLIVMRADEWQQRRKILLPFFKTKKVEEYVQTITESALRLLKEHDQQGKYVVNIAKVMERLAFYNIGHLLFNYNLENEPHELHVAIMGCFNKASRFMQYPLSAPLWIPTSSNRLFHKQLKKVDDLAYRIIAHTRQTQGDTMVNALIKQEGITEQGLRDEIVTIILGGHETVAASLTWFWYLMAQHPDVVDKIQKELKSVLNGEMPTLETIKQLEYTQMALNESLRLYPPVWAVSRYAEEADRVMGHDIKKGGQIVLPLYVTHRNPDFWEKPNEFYPEHFNEEATSKRAKHAFMPFGSGERVCIGRQLGWMEMMMIISVILQHATPEKIIKGKNVKPLALFTLRPDRDIMISFSKNT
jgi:cytochrome P450